MYTYKDAGRIANALKVDKPPVKDLFEKYNQKMAAKVSTGCLYIYLYNHKIKNCGMKYFLFLFSYFFISEEKLWG